MKGFIRRDNLRSSSFHIDLVVELTDWSVSKGSLNRGLEQFVEDSKTTEEGWQAAGEETRIDWGLHATLGVQYGAAAKR